MVELGIALVIVGAVMFAYGFYSSIVGIYYTLQGMWRGFPGREDQ